MAPTKNNKTAPRARLAHKLARYVRANYIHLESSLTASNPSTTQLIKMIREKNSNNNNIINNIIRLVQDEPQFEVSIQTLLDGLLLFAVN